MNVERLTLIEQALSASDYTRTGDLPLAKDMHAPQGGAIIANSPPAYLDALTRPAHSIEDDLAYHTLVR